MVLVEVDGDDVEKLSQLLQMFLLAIDSNCLTLCNSGERSNMFMFVSTFLSPPGEQYKSTNNDMHLQLIVRYITHIYQMCVNTPLNLYRFSSMRPLTIAFDTLM